MEFKTIPVYPQDVKDRTITGFAAVMGNIDKGNERIRPGAFAKTLTDRKEQVPHLWQHDFNAPPTATVTALTLVKRDGLPSEILADYPDANGGLMVSRTYLPTPRGEEVFQGILGGAIKGMSFGYEVPRGKSEYVKVGDVTVRDLLEVKLIETSDTPFPMNPAARAQKSALLYNLLGALDGIDDMTTLMAMGQALTPDQLVACQQCITLCMTLLNQALQADQLENVLTEMGVMSEPVTALRKAIAGAVWLHTPEDLILNAATQVRSGLKTARPELFTQDGLPVDLIRQLQTKQGRMISAANEAKIKNVIDNLVSQLDTLQNLLGAAEPPDEKALTDTATLLALLELDLVEYQ